MNGERLLETIARWRPLFERGEVRPLNGRPMLTAGERLAVQIDGVRVAGRGRPSADGALYVSDRRAAVFGDAAGPVREWQLAELQSIRALGNWRGLALPHDGGDTELVVTASPTPPTAEDAAAWLKAEAAFAAATGRLADWAAGLPDRVGAITDASGPPRTPTSGPANSVTTR